MKFGRKRPTSRPRFMLEKYLSSTVTLPTPPDECDYSPKAASALALMYLNDTLGDCVIAGGAHLRGVTSSNQGGAAGAPTITFTDLQIIAMYSAIGGYNPADPSTDQGCDEQTALDYWTGTGFPDDIKLLGSCGVDATNESLVKSAIFMFENVMFGVELPDEWVNPMPSDAGFTWDVAGDPDPNNGHCVVGVGYNEQGVIISTWGMLGLMTWAAVAKYAVPAAGGELHVALSADTIAKGQALSPSGLNWTELTTDLAHV